MAKVRGIVLNSHSAGLSDEDRLLGLSRIGPADAIVACSLRSRGRATVWNLRRDCFVIIGLRCDLDGHVCRGSLDGAVFTLRDCSFDSSLPKWLLNLPHCVLATLALFIGFTRAVLDRTVAR